MKRILAGLFAVIAWSTAVLAQIQPGSGISINQTPVQNGTSGRCLYINGAVVGQQVCGAGTAADITVGTTTVTGGTTSGLMYKSAGGFVGTVSGWTSDGSNAITGGASTSVAIGGAIIGGNALGIVGSIGQAGAVTADVGIFLGKITPTEAAANTYNFAQIGFTNASGSRLNQQYVQGWNVGVNGQPIDATQPSLGTTVESYYKPDGTHTYMEWYVQYFPPSSLTYQRPFSVGINQVNGSIESQLQFSTLNFLNAAGTTVGSISGTASPIFSISPPVNITAFQINGPTQTTAAIPLANYQVTWNNAAAIFSGVVFNVTNTASNAASLLYDWQVGGSTKASVSVAGRVTAVNSFASPLYQFTSNTRMLSPSDGVIEFLNNASSAFTRLQFGGTTTGFVALGSSTTTLSVLLADGSSGGTLAVTGAITNTGITTDATHVTSTVCQDTTSHQYYFGSASLGICLGTSGRQFKTAFAPMAVGIDELMKIDFINYRYRDGYGDSGASVQYGTTAQAVEEVIPDIARHNAKGETINYDSGALLFVGLRAIQQLKADNDNLRQEINELKRTSR